MREEGVDERGGGCRDAPDDALAMPCCCPHPSWTWREEDPRTPAPAVMTFFSFLRAGLKGGGGGGGHGSNE